MLLSVIVVLLLVLVATWAILGYVGYRTAICRGRELDIRNRESLLGTSWDVFYDEIMEGIAWIESQQRESVELVSSDGLRLVGRLTRHREAKGIVLMFHGYRTHPEVDFSASSPVYYGAGNHIVHIDQRACGESEGKHIGFGIQESLDVVSWCQWVQETFGEDFPIFLAGLSMGAATVLMATGRNLPGSVQGIVADSAFSSPAEMIEAKIRQTYKIKGRMLSISVGMWTRLLAGFSLTELSIPSLMEKNKIPVFFIHGMADTLVPVEMTQRAIAACKGQKEVLLIPGAEHGTGYLVDNRRYQRMLREFVSLGARGTDSSIG